MATERAQRLYLFCTWPPVAYKPERSSIAPFRGSPFVLKQISEDEARALIEKMTENIDEDR
jgi:hypothetical protein